MKKILVLLVALILVFVSVGIAEDVPFSEWIAGQDRVVADVFAGEVAAPEVPTPEAPVPEIPAFEPIGIGSRGETVAQLQAKLIELGVLNSKADGVFGPASEEAVKYTQKALGWEETGVIQTADELNTILALVPGDGVNLAVGTSDEWSEWMAPEYNAENKCFYVAYAYLGERTIGDAVTCQAEIEFSGVVPSVNENGENPFAFYSQGAVDGAWEGKNMWNPSLVRLDAAPANGVYKYVYTSVITERNVTGNQFNLGFRCDYWAGGQFRVRNIKIEKGILATAWSPALLDVGDGINLAVGTSSEWSEWMIPEADTNNRNFYLSSVDLTDKVVGESYTCQFEVEFADARASAINDGESVFAFKTQGPVDGAWEVSNIWNWSFVTLNEAPANGVYKYTKTVRITDKNVNATHFDLGFRCDYWASGQFRVRNTKVERGMNATSWTPAP